jgi:hypothetical protein
MGYTELFLEIKKNKVEEKEFDRLFSKWIKLRTKFREAKSSKNWLRIIEIASEIIEFDKTAKSIGIFLPVFEVSIANAYLKLENREVAIAHYHTALEGFILENKKQPTSWLKEIARITKKIERLESK